MPNQAGGAAQVISLPKGGGALQGLGEKFSPDLYTGTGNFSVPLAVPPGRNGLQPQLALTYSTGQGNGPLGLGWSLSVPGVTLKTSKGIPRYQGHDTYLLSGAEDLVLVTEEPVSTVGNGWSWGDNSRGALGDGSTTTRSTPAQVSAPAGIVAIAAGSHSLALAPDGMVWAWGYNIYGQLGDGTTTERLTPVQVSGLSGVVAIAAGHEHSLALKFDGTVWAWGQNAYGNLGDGTRTTRLTPVQVSGLTDVVAIAAGGYSLALKSDGTVWAWGYNGHGSCGDGLEGAARPSIRDTPVQVTNLSGVVAIAAGALHGLALKSDGTVWAWGLNDAGLLGAAGGGQLGDGTMTTRSTPVPVMGLGGVVAIAAGSGHSLALQDDDTLWAWGVNGFGQLGDGTTTARLTPVPVRGLVDVIAIAAGHWHSLALTRADANGTHAPQGYRRQYRPRTEGLFARIVHHQYTNNEYWEVRSKDGLVSYYGTPHAAGTDLAVVADPSSRRKIFAWKLTRTIDTFGNRIEYEYMRDAGQDVFHQWDQLYLQRIRYVDYAAQGATKYLVSVTFFYADRPDPFSDYRAGFEIRTTKRCTRIEIRTHADQERLVRAYDLVYLDERDGLEQRLPYNGVSLLSQLTVTGYDGDHAEEMPPLEFGYAAFEPTTRRFSPLQGRDLPATSLAHSDLELVDLFGNGLPDILEMNGTVRYWRNLGGSRFDLPREMRTAPAGVGLADKGVQLLDANGDGRMDLLVTTEMIAGYFPLQFGGLWDRRSFRSYDQAPSFDLKDPEVHLVDLDGDGVTDAIRSGSHLECFFNDPQQGWNGTRWVERRALEEFPNVNFSDSRVKWADMSGDGLQDIVLVHDGSVEYWPNLGYGNWGKKIHIRNSPRLPYGYDPKRILVGDVDGDGLADIVYVDNTKVTLWINQSGNGWSDPIVIKGTPPVSDMDAVRLADVLGTGVSGVLWSADASGLSRQHMFFLDFTGGSKPYLLHEMNNHLGAVTRVAYAPSTRFYRPNDEA